ncbi:ArnT family glycosyltransferase [Halobacillus yeomjeoni]|uniref:Glycosyltransferase family 39 protein n=1 Tax=Halobacillus yeomjeoni TaxID=311194 RepID=A0A931MV64_9BACI|nr:glycosyltransferase family 39 protein [Halobacillus yeomjeoni]MBH0230698.1 glycosyltransferase family 39 protein [Halobacillus yeomjeoni]
MHKLLNFIKLFSISIILLFGIIYAGGGFYFNAIRFDQIFIRPDFLVILAGFGLMGIFYLISRLNLPKRFFLPGLLGVAFIIRFIWVWVSPTVPESDFLMLYNAANAATEGDFGFTENAYFQKWVYQLGFVMYQAAVINMFGDSIFVLQFINILFSVAIIWLVYEITREVFNENAGRIAGLVYTFYIPAIVMTSLLTNQILATFLFYAGALLLVKSLSEKKWSWVIIGVLFALGHIIRPLGPFVLLATGIFLFVVYVLGQKRKTAGINLMKFSGIIATYFLIITLASQALMMSGISDYPLENRDPKWKFVLGLNHETKGTYSNEDAETLSGLEWEERLEKEEEMIDQRLSNPSRLTDLFVDKFSIMWGNRDASISWSYGDGDENIRERLYQLDKVLYIQFFIFAFTAFVALMIHLWKNHSDKKIQSLFFVLFIIGYAMIHLIIEIQTRYRFVMMPSLIILQSYGVYAFFNQSLKLSIQRLKRTQPSEEAQEASAIQR